MQFTRLNNLSDMGHRSSKKDNANSPYFKFYVSKRLSWIVLNISSNNECRYSQSIPPEILYSPHQCVSHNGDNFLISTLGLPFILSYHNTRTSAQAISTVERTKEYSSMRDYTYSQHTWQSLVVPVVVWWWKVKLIFHENSPHHTRTKGWLLFWARLLVIFSREFTTEAVPRGHVSCVLIFVISLINCHCQRRFTGAQSTTTAASIDGRWI